MANSKPEKAIMKANGIKSKIKKIKPEHIMLKVKPLKMLNNMCPDNRPTNLSFSLYNLSVVKLFVIFSNFILYMIYLLTNKI